MKISEFQWKIVPKSMFFKPNSETPAPFQISFFSLPYKTINKLKFKRLFKIFFDFRQIWVWKLAKRFEENFFAFGQLCWKFRFLSFIYSILYDRNFQDFRVTFTNYSLILRFCARWTNLFLWVILKNVKVFPKIWHNFSTWVRL